MLLFILFNDSFCYFKDVSLCSILRKFQPLSLQVFPLAYYVFPVSGTPVKHWSELILSSMSHDFSFIFPNTLTLCNVWIFCSYLSSNLQILYSVVSNYIVLVKPSIKYLYLVIIFLFPVFLFAKLFIVPCYFRLFFMSIVNLKILKLQPFSGYSIIWNSEDLISLFVVSIDA